MRISLTALLAAALVSCGGGQEPASKPAPPTPAPTVQPASTVELRDARFVPDRVAAGPGEQITLIGGDDRHLIAIRALKARIPVEPGDTVAFLAPSEPGEHRMMCRIHDGMRGTLVVR